VRARTGQTGTPDVPVGFEAIRVSFALTGEIPDDRRERLRERTESYCVVLQTLLTSPAIHATWEVLGGFASSGTPPFVGVLHRKECALRIAPDRSDRRDGGSVERSVDVWESLVTVVAPRRAQSVERDREDTMRARLVAVERIRHVHEVRDSVRQVDEPLRPERRREERLVHRRGIPRGRANEVISDHGAIWTSSAAAQVARASPASAGAGPDPTAGRHDGPSCGDHPAAE
jgi:hypothetical protein